MKNLFIAIAAIGAISCIGREPIQTPFKSDWTSLRNHTTPQWLVDAKFGIYCHWGLSTLKYIPEYENLSNDERLALFKGEKFDAAEWAALFETAGAKFGGVIGWHGSKLKHWDSDLSDYTTAKQGPKIDIVGEVSKAVRDRDMKFILTLHSIRDDDWIDFAKEAVDKYDPDIVWVDASFGGTKGGQHRGVLDRSEYIGEHTEPLRAFPEKYQRDFISYFYNRGLENGKEVEFMYKSNDIPPNIAMRDLENGMLPRTAYDVWITDMDINAPPDFETHGWFYREGIRTRSADELVDMLVDVVSKNGLFLLNLPPMADGTFPEEVVTSMTELGTWLEANGEAIYGTNPWFIYGQGPTEIPGGNYTYHHNNHFAQIQFAEDDIRFTVKGDNLYAICLGKPGGDLSIEALNTTFKLHDGDIRRIIHLGTGSEISFDHNAAALVLDLDAVALDEKANAFRIERRF